jgi:hypothetical protein
MRALVPAAAVLTGGFALYFTHSVLDLVLIDGRAVRVALVPGWPVFVAFLAMGALAVLWLARQSRPRAVTSVPIRWQLGALLLPVFTLILVILPYAPVLPDWLPGLQMAAGPLKWIVWLATGGLFAWVLWHTRIVRTDWVAHLTRAQAAVLVGALTAAVSGAAAARLGGTVLFPGGDEPHYLVMAQSVWRDGDLKIENNHARGDYREYFGRELKPDYLTRGSDEEIYSIHPVGLPVLMAPVYAAGGYWGVVIALVLSAAVAAAVMWRFTLDMTNAPGATTFAWAAVVLTTPFLYNTFTVYPEIVAAVAVAIAFSRAIDASAWPRGQWRWLAVGLACAALPWLSTKYAPMSATLVLIALARLNPLRAPKSAAAVVLPYGLSLLAWFAFFYTYWGTPMPSAPYGALVQTSPKNLVFGAPGLLFDQEYGVLAYAPVYILAVTGLVTMLRAGGDERRRAIETALTFGALLGTVGAFRIWWGGAASPGRPLASGLLLLALPIAMAARSAPAPSARRAGHHLLLWVSIGVALTLALAQQGLLLNNARDGTSTLLEYWSPSWNVWALAPTFIFHEAPTSWLHSLAWLAVAFGAAVVLARWRTRSAGGAVLAAVTTFVAALLVVGAVLPRLPNDPPLPEANVSARWRVPILDRYDVAARPLGIVYDPMRFEPAPELLSLGSVEVVPGLRSAPQPLRVLHNGRFSLPAGRYRADVEWSAGVDGALPIGLQVGRIEPEWKTWTVQPQPGARWEVDFDLPVTANFVAFRGSTDLERAIGRLTITPLAIVDESARPNVPVVLAARQYGDAAMLFHDERSSPEPTGFWVLGGERARVTIVRESDETPLVLRVHSGLEPNDVTISMRGWHETLTLDAAAPQTITLPDSNRRLLTIDVHSESGFSPTNYHPDSRDFRFLGAWVEFVQPGAPQP